MTLTHPVLLDAVAGDGVGFRARIPLEPLGGPGDKIAPPTYSVSESAKTKYAVEECRVDGESVDAVVLDSVASQANRFESALLAAHREEELQLPLVYVDFREAEGVEGLDRISSLEAPRRIFDAILRDSLLDDTLFRLSEVGQAITEAAPRDRRRSSVTRPTLSMWSSPAALPVHGSPRAPARGSVEASAILSATRG